MYLDDIKLHIVTDNHFRNLLRIADVLTRDFRMEFGLDKFSIQFIPKK